MMTGHQRPYAWLLAVSTVITVTLDVLLYDVWGIEGIALATTVMLALQNIVQVVYLKRVAGFTTTADLRATFAEARSFLAQQPRTKTPERSGSPSPTDSPEQREEPLVVRGEVRGQAIGDGERRWRVGADVAIGRRPRPRSTRRARGTRAPARERIARAQRRLSTTSSCSLRVVRPPPLELLRVATAREVAAQPSR